MFKNLDSHHDTNHLDRKTLIETLVAQVEVCESITKEAGSAEPEVCESVLSVGQLHPAYRRRHDLQEPNSASSLQNKLQNMELELENLRKELLDKVSLLWMIFLESVGQALRCIPFCNAGLRSRSAQCKASRFDRATNKGKSLFNKQSLVIVAIFFIQSSS